MPLPRATGGAPADTKQAAVSSSVLIAGAAAVALAVGAAVMASNGTDPGSIVASIEDAVAASGWLGPAVFIAVYAVATVFLFPASVLTLAAGALFGKCCRQPCDLRAWFRCQCSNSAAMCCLYQTHVSMTMRQQSALVSPVGSSCPWANAQAPPACPRVPGASPAAC